VPTLAAVAANLGPAYAALLTRTAPAPLPGASGLTPADGGAASGRAGTPVEMLRLPGADPATTSFLESMEQALVGAGASLRPGDVLVTTLPNHEVDIDRQAPRPSVVVAGDAAVRVVALSGTGEVLTDTTLATGPVAVPWHTARLVAWCTGGTGVPPAGLAGWSATDRLPWVGAGVTLAAGSVVTGFPAPDRGFRSADAAWVTAATPAAQASVVATELPPTTTVVVVSVDASADADLAQFSLGLSGAQRLAQPDGTASAPILVASGGRAHLCYDVVPTGAGPVVVSVGSGPAWRLAGALGGPGDAATTASQLAAVGAGNCVAPLICSPTGLATVQWVPAAAGPAGPPGDNGGADQPVTSPGLVTPATNGSEA
jgi:hypothetical protein